MEEKSANNIILCGLPGVGKTSVGRLLAKKMERGFIDTDDEIEQLVGMSCREYYQKLGREAFRKIESETILKLIGQTNKVIALGGGCIESTHVYAQFKRLGSIVHLCNDVDFLAQRKIGHDKPAYIKGRDDYHKLAAYRLPLFYSVADFNLHLRETTIHEAVEMIMAEIKRIHGK
jgi:shikimate kinase